MKFLFTKVFNWADFLAFVFSALATFHYDNLPLAFLILLVGLVGSVLGERALIKRERSK